MTQNHSDALVFFGATGDLAYKKIFPALQAMLKRGNLNVPVIGVAKAGWTLDLFFSRDIEQMLTLRDVEALSDMAGRIRTRAMQQTSITAASRPVPAIRDQP